MPFAEDLTPFFDVAVFGTTATYKGTTTVRGIFDREYREALTGIEGTGPTFVCALADVPAVAHGDTLLINAATYKVRGVEPDGTGVVLLRLEVQ